MLGIFSDKQAIYGAFKMAKIEDADVLYSTKTGMLTPLKMFKIISWIFTAMGAFLCITLIGIPVGVLFIGASWYVRVKIKKYKKNIEEIYQEYLNKINSGSEQPEDKTVTI